MKNIKKETKRGQHFWASYDRSNKYTLKDVYKNCSYTKELAFNYILRQCNKLDGKGVKILGANCMAFSVGFLTDKGLVVYTKDNIYLIK